jgi:hypothetical protein
MKFEPICIRDESVAARAAKLLGRRDVQIVRCYNKRGIQGPQITWRGDGSLAATYASTLCNIAHAILVAE